jgi:hydrogenase nickel incorporation protein HypA/HybF
MHEMGIAMRIVEIAISAIPPDIEDARIERVNLKVGRLTAVVPESLRFCFSIASSDTPLAGASLEIEETPIVVECDECGAETTIERPLFACGECGSGKVTIVSGRELDILSIEVADPEVEPNQGRG